MEKKYRSSIESRAVAQIASLDEDAQYSRALGILVALAVEYRNFGPIVLDVLLESGELRWEGPFTCGQAYRLQIGALRAIISISRDSDEMIVRDVCAND